MEAFGKELIDVGNLGNYWIGEFTAKDGGLIRLQLQKTASARSKVNLKLIYTKRFPLPKDMDPTRHNGPLLKMHVEAYGRTPVEAQKNLLTRMEIIDRRVFELLSEFRP